MITISYNSQFIKPSLLLAPFHATADMAVGICKAHLSLSFTLICQKNGVFRKRYLSRRNLEALALRSRMEGKKLKTELLENVGVR